MTTREKYINPFTDFGFKKLFGTELNKDLLIDFLNEVVLPKKRRITDLSYSKNEQIGKSDLDRKAIFDIYCIGVEGERFIVEMQKAKQNYFKERSVYYATFPIQEQALRGNWDFNLAEIYTVGVLDFLFTDGPNDTHAQTNSPQVRHEVKLKNQKNQVFYDKLTFIYLEMPNFTKTEEELETPYDKWLYVLKNLPSLQDRPIKLQEKVFKHLFATAEIAKFSPAEQDQYVESLKVYRDLKNVIDTSFSDGKIEGILEGILRAIQQAKLTDMEIAEVFSVTVDYVLKVRRDHNL